jgi:hypothetical protein
VPGLHVTLQLLPMDVETHGETMRLDEQNPNE